MVHVRTAWSYRVVLTEMPAKHYPLDQESPPCNDKNFTSCLKENILQPRLQRPAGYSCFREIITVLRASHTLRRQNTYIYGSALKVTKKYREYRDLERPTS
jgi:hypothetical protein